jgi:hypothetical protein
MGIVAAILDEAPPPQVTLFELALGTPVQWVEQEMKFRDES